MWGNIMGLIAIILSFEYTLFFIVQSIFQMDEGGAGLRVFSILFFIPVVVKFFTSTIQHLKNKDYIVLIFVTAVLSLFYLTRIRYGYVEPGYRGSFLSFGVRGLPAIFTAVIIAKNKDYFTSMQKWLQPIMLIYSLGVILVVTTSKNTQYIQFNFSRGGMNYQTLSYCSAFAFNINLFLILMRGQYENFKIFDNEFWKIVNMILLPVQIYCLFTGGGRGAMGNIVVVAAFLIYARIGCKLSVRAVGGTVIVAFIAFFAVSYIANKTGNTGAVRLMEFFGNKESVLNNERTSMRSVAVGFFWEKPIFGYGLGSVYYIMGIYSHNLFTDVLMEGGLAFFIPVCIIIGIIVIFHKRMILMDINNVIQYMIFLSSFMMLMFSGYYFNDGGIWFAGTYLIYIITDDWKRRKILRRYNDEL